MAALTAPCTRGRMATVARMGFNPFREQVRRRSDVLLVAAAFVVVAALVAWALFGA